VTINTTKTRQKNMKTGVMILSQYFFYQINPAETSFNNI